MPGASSSLLHHRDWLRRAGLSTRHEALQDIFRRCGGGGTNEVTPHTPGVVLPNDVPGRLRKMLIGSRPPLGAPRVHNRAERHTKQHNNSGADMQRRVEAVVLLTQTAQIRVTGAGPDPRSVRSTSTVSRRIDNIRGCSGVSDWSSCSVGLVRDCSRHKFLQHVELSCNPVLIPFDSRL